MKITLTLFTALTILLFTQSCGTIIQGSTQQIGFSSSPTNASVTINGNSYGVTPLLVDLKRKQAHIVVIELDGYLPYETNLTRSTSGWVLGNIIFGGLIGLVVDASAGGMYKLSPEQVRAELSSGRADVLSEEDGLFISFVLEADPSWEKIGNLELKK